jgi:hypothetical protein
MPPTPKRSSERRRRNLESKPDKVDAVGEVVAPEPSPDWHPIALAWYESLGESGQVCYFEPSDWAAAVYVAEAMSLQLTAVRPSAQLFTGVWQAMGDLMTTEAQRRRLRVEIERGQSADGEAPEGVTALDEYRRTLGAG